MVWGTTPETLKRIGQNACVVYVSSHAYRFAAEACEPVPASKHMEPNSEQPHSLQQVSQRMVDNRSDY